MKKCISLLAIILLSIGTGFAQSGNNKKSSIADRTDQMAKELGLSAEQKKQLLELNVELARKMNEVRQDSQTNRTDLHEAMKTIREEYKEDLKDLLTEEQYQQYLEIEKKRREEMRKMRDHGDSRY